MYQIRSYRNWIEDKDLVSFQIKLGESDLFIRADKLLLDQARACLGKHRQLIQDYIQKHPQFATALEPYPVEDKAPEIIKEMARASFACGVGPMAAVAGALAEYVGRDLLLYAQEVIVENGGDIFIKSRRRRRVGIFAGKSCYTAKLALEIEPALQGQGICTSSGTVGPSLSFGQADAAVVMCNSAILADAWATSLGNMVKSGRDVPEVLQLAQGKPEIKAVVIIIGEQLGVWGEVKLVPVEGGGGHV